MRRFPFLLFVFCCGMPFSAVGVSSGDAKSLGDAIGSEGTCSNYNTVAAVLGKNPALANSKAYDGTNSMLALSIMNCCEDDKTKCRNEQGKIAKLLIEKGADVNEDVRYGFAVSSSAPPPLKGTLLDMVRYNQKHHALCVSTAFQQGRECKEIERLLVANGALTSEEKKASNTYTLQKDTQEVINSTAKAPSKQSATKQEGETYTLQKETPEIINSTAKAPEVAPTPAPAPAPAAQPAKQIVATTWGTSDTVEVAVNVPVQKEAVSQQSQSRTIKISGIIKDEVSKETIPSVTVKACADTECKDVLKKGVGILGVSSDLDGKFELSDVPDGAYISLSSVGYESQIIPAKNINGDLYLKAGKTLNEVKLVADKISAGDPCGPYADEYIVSGTYQKAPDSKWICIPTQCADGYVIKSEDGTTKCAECTIDNFKYDNATDVEIRDGNCVVKGCDTENGYELKDDKCVKPEAPEPEAEPEPKPDPEAQQKLIEEKQAAYDAAKAKEQSLANRTLTAATTAATGLGAMELARGLSEQKADKDAAADMAAYFATFRCEYGDGKSVKAGESEIELPGGNDAELMRLRNEYFTLAKDLKERKTALGMKLGIESEEILDKSQMGLYDDEFVGITEGNLEEGSIYRATVLKSESDQAKLDAMKDASKKRVVGGAIAAGAGVVGGVVGDSLVNGKLGEKIKEIKDKRAKNKENESVINELKDGLKSAGMVNVDKLDLSSFDLTELKEMIDNTDFNELSYLKGKDATDLINTSNLTSFTSSFEDLF